MRLRNKTLETFNLKNLAKLVAGLGLLAFVFLLALTVGAQEVPTPAQPAQQSTAPIPPPDNQPASAQGQKQQGQELEREGSEGFILRKDVQEVALHATVLDDKHRLVTDLGRQDFAVYENGVPQKITSFRREDIPVSIGIVIDNSGSMRDKRPAVNQAALNLVRASNSQDEVFIVNFNDEYYLDQDFTANLKKLQEGLEKIDSRGGTALYDAIVASAAHLEKHGKLDKRVILVVTDGEDNASRESLEQAIRKLDVDNGPTVYAIGLLGDEHQKRAKRALEAMAQHTGGEAFFPKDLREVDSITKEVAHDIRNQYTIGYKPDMGKTGGGYRTVHVDAKAPGHGKLQVRTRTGYYAGTEQASNQGN
jgi:Ca-activated chloride channel homolog